MAQLTPQEILDISEPIEAIYQRTVDELLINIAHHFNISGWERTRYWEIKKLSEMGALTKESADIIAKNTQMLPEEIEKAFLEVSEKACLDIDPQLKDAAKKGILQDPGTTPTTSVLMRDNLRSYVNQAVDTMNMVNTTMLQSTREAYLQGITTAVNEAQLHEAKEILETQSLEVVTGQETRTMAIRKAMNQLTNTGITGFYDKAGRKWHAEAYAAMVIRSTSHNAAVEAIKTRQQEFGGGDIFQVSAHPGARPLCYPYQHKFYSWTQPGGEFTDGAGHTHKYENIDATSYGEPAGLFGINCGHNPIPMIPGYSFPQTEPVQSEEENKKEYEESQKQRALEREIRENKRDLEIAKATGDEEAIKAAKQKVADSQAKMRGFINETDRPRRYDREQIPGTGIPQGLRGVQRERDSDIPTNGPKWTTGKRQSKAQAAAGQEGVVFDFSKSKTPEKYAQSQTTLQQLSGEYNTRLKTVTTGAKQAAGDVDITGEIMRLNTNKVEDAIHEFAHTLANTDSDKYGLTNTQEFWKEIRKVRTEYSKAVLRDYKYSISAYANSKDINEFMAEAFTQAKARQLGIKLSDKYSDDTTYSSQVLAIIDKYFRKEGPVKQRDEEAEKLIDGLIQSKVQYRQVEKLKTQLKEAEIIQRLAGGDKTAGSCSSLAFAYIGNKGGLDVLDFRGGNSQSFFSRNKNIQSMGKLNGVSMDIMQVEKEAADTWKLLKDIPQNVEYYLAVGKHAAIVKRTDAGVQYLEMQSAKEDGNGWQPFEGNKYWSTPTLVLQKRFGCRKTVDKMKLFSGDFVFKKDVVLMEVDSFEGSESFQKILGYINTAPDEQKKGATGGLR